MSATVTTTDDRGEILRELSEHRALLAATPDQGFDSHRKRDEIKADIDALLDLLNETPPHSG